MKAKRAKDRYDLEIEDIRVKIASRERASEVIRRHWTDPRENGGLFSFCSPSRESGDKGYGCLTQITGSGFKSADPELTEAILNSSLPLGVSLVGLRHLSQFARWQRKMDAMWPGRGEMLMPEGFERRLREAQEKAQ